MKVFKKIVTIATVIIMMTSIRASCNKNMIGNNLRVVEGKPVKISVLLYNLDAYISLVKQNLEQIQRENEGKVEFTFYNAENNQDVQNNTLNTILEQKDTDLILLNLVDTGSTKEAINKIKENNIPVILFNREPVDINAVKSYNKACFVGTNAEQSGILQGKIMIDLWNKEKKFIDKNNDNTIQYVMLMGPRNNIEAIARTKYSILTINQAGINTQEVAVRVCNWEKAEAKDATEALILKYGDKIEAIISNNDSMAIGAIETLQARGYNKGDKTKTIAVIGVDAIPEAKDFINKGVMAGTVVQDAPAMAEALYSVGMNLVFDRAPLDGTSFKFDETGVAIRIPYKEYIEVKNY